MKAKASRRWLHRVSLCASLLLPVAAFAEDVVHLKAGGSIRGDVMELIPNEYVNVRLADGTSRRIQWTQVERVEEDAAAVLPAPTYVQPATPVPIVVTTSQGRGSSPEEAARKQVLINEITRLEQERSQLRTGPSVVMMLVGYASLSVALPLGLLLWLAPDTCDFEGECNDDGTRSAGVALSVVGAAGAVVGVVGLVQLIGVSADRRDVNDQIQIRQQQLNALSYDLNLGPQRADLTFRLQF